MNAPTQAAPMIQSFEAYPKLAAHIEYMGNHISGVSLSKWGAFLAEINATIDHLKSSGTVGEEVPYVKDVDIPIAGWPLSSPAPAPGEVDEHKHVYLSPSCGKEMCMPDDRCWSEDDMGPCDECGAPSVKYVRDGLHLPTGEGAEAHDDFIYQEALSEIMSLVGEYECLNGGGPGWQDRWNKARSHADDITRNEP